MNQYDAVRLFLLRQTLRRRDRWTRQQLERHQAQASFLLRAHAYRASPFYRWFHAGLLDRPLQELPSLSKTMLMEHFDELVTDPAVRLADIEAHVLANRWNEAFLGRYRLLISSGTSGQRGFFLFNRAEWRTVLASYARATRDWPSLAAGWPRRRRAAGVSSAAPWHVSAQVNTDLRSRLSPTLVIDAADQVETIVERLNAWQPELLMGYPTALHVLAQEQLAQRLRITPQTTITSSEVLTDDTRQHIEEAWGQAPYNLYGSTEGACLASSCQELTGLHLSEDLVIVEVVDNDNRPVSRGIYGDKVLITVLFSRTLPLIRYELSDRVRLASGLCPCGRPFAMIDSIEGRKEDLLVFQALDGSRRIVNPQVFYLVLGLVPCQAWQVIQEPGQLRVLLSGVSESFADQTLISALQQALAAQNIIVPCITIQRVASIPRGATGKHAYVVRATDQGAGSAS